MSLAMLCRLDALMGNRNGGSSTVHRSAAAKQTSVESITFLNPERTNRTASTRLPPSDFCLESSDDERETWSVDDTEDGVCPPGEEIIDE